MLVSEEGCDVAGHKVCCVSSEDGLGIPEVFAAGGDGRRRSTQTAAGPGL